MAAPLFDDRPAEAVTPAEALHAYTTGSAHAVGTTVVGGQALPDDGAVKIP